MLTVEFGFFPEALASLATGRTSDLFLTDFEARKKELEGKVSGKRVLVIGGAGSIGSATVKLLASFNPRSLHVVDHNENGLAELVRDLRGSPGELGTEDFRTLPLDFGSPVMRRFLLGQKPYDFALNFAALKHVRSEKDVCSLLQLLDTNVVKMARLIGWLSESGFHGRYFCVSTDKAANPTSLMGASKRVLEHVLFSGEVARVSWECSASARFANVAFSGGSLLEGFLNRLQKRQPMAAPRETRRYFVSLRESGLICLLASLCGPDRHVVIPRLDPARDLKELSSVAEGVIRRFGFKPRHYDDERLAVRSMDADIAGGFYPLILTPLDTSGEKPYEEFVGSGESAVEIGMESLRGIGYVPAPAGSVARLVKTLESLLADPGTPVEKDDLVRLIATVVPHLKHRETGKNLDQRL